jgi:cyanophycin synthetase
LSEGNLVQLGYGARQRRIWTAETDQTSAVGESISRNKDLTKELLRACGVPVPVGRIVNSAADAWEAAEDIGLPVVVKPSDGNHGRGISIDLNKQADIEAAYHLALQHGSDVIVERFVPGNEHRVLVVGGRVVAAARGETAWVVGDGRSTVTQLIDSQLNADPRRGPNEEFPLNTIVVDEDAAVMLELSRQGFAPDGVPEEGQRVLIQRNGNVAIDVTAQVHPEVAAAVSLAARITGLEIAGVDLVAQDIARPLEEQSGAIVEVNAGPGLLMHVRPAQGEPQPVGRAIVDHLFPEGASGRIPITGITGSKGKTVVAHLLTRMLKLTGKQVGLACSDGLYFGRRHVRATDAANWEGGHAVLLNPSVEAAVFENGLRMILNQGLAYDRCQVGIVTNINPADIAPEFFVEDAEQIFDVLRAQVDVVLDNGCAVLNADDPLVARMAPLCDGEVIFFGLDEKATVIVEHRAQGGRVVIAKDGGVLLANGRDEQRLVEFKAVPMLSNAADAPQTANVLAAIAAAWALGITSSLICAALETCHAGQNEMAA